MLTESDTEHLYAYAERHRESVFAEVHSLV